MNPYFFWANWQKHQKVLYTFLFAVFILSLVFFTACYFIGISAVILWEVSSVVEPMLLTLSKFTLNLFEFALEVEGFAMLQRFYATVVQINLTSAYVYLPFVTIGFLFGITLSTFLKSFSYFVSTTIVLLFLVFLNTDLLGVFNLYDKTIPAALVLSLGALSFYFYSFSTNTSFLLRLIVFALLLMVFAIVVILAGQVKHPLLYLANFGITGPVLVTLFFIFIIGFEPVNLFLHLTAGTARTPNNRNRIFNFILISLLYLANVILVLLRKMLFIDWDLLYLNAFLLYALSAIIGIWGYKQRSVTFKEFIPFRPLGGLLYLSLAIIANATIAYSFITGNDPLTECFEYAIIYSHVCFGFVFFIYVLINFGGLFPKNVSITEIVYKPLNLPFFMVRGIGAAAIFSIFMYSNRFAFYLGLAGYFNLGGDVYEAEGNRLLAKQYYRSGVQYEFQNHRSNYSLAAIADQENDKDAVLEYYSRTLVKRPTEFDYINLSNFYLKEDGYFQAMFILKDGLEKFPESGYLANNLSLLYNRTRLTDSSLYYLQHSISHLTEAEVPVANTVYFAAKSQNQLLGDSTLSRFSFPANTAYLSNQYHWNNLYGKIFYSSRTASLSDSITPTAFALFYNAHLNQVFDKKSTHVVQVSDSLLALPANAGYADAIGFLKALQLYYSGQTRAAFAILENLQNLSSNSSYYHKVSGIWKMEQGAYRSAAQSFKISMSQGGESSALNYSMAMAEAGSYEQAQEVVISLRKSKQTTIKEIALTLQQIYTSPPDTVVARWTDYKKLQYLHLQGASLGESQLLQIYQSINQQSLQVPAGIELSRQYLMRHQAERAENIYKQLLQRTDLTGIDRNLLNKLRLDILVHQQRYQDLLQLAKTVELNHSQKHLQGFYIATALRGLGKYREAEPYYTKLIQAAPFLEEGILGAVQLQVALKKPAVAYNIISDAIQFYPTSVVLLKEYCLQALDANLVSYAGDALSQLSALVSPEELKAFQTIFSLKKSEAERRLIEP